MSRKRWRKSWEEKWRDEASDLLGFEGRALRSLLGDVAELVEGSDVGWALDSQGRPYTRVRLARLLAATEAQVDLAVEQLLAAGLILDDARGLGLLDWRRTQEDPSAERQRRRRGHERDEECVGPVTPGVTVTRAVTPASPPEDRGQRTEDRKPAAAAGADTRESFDPAAIAQRLRDAREHGAAPLPVEAAARRSGIPATALRDLEAGRASPTCAELESLARAYGDPSLLGLPGLGPGAAEQVLDALFEARQGLGAEEPRPRLDGDVVRYVHAPEPWLPEGLSLLDAWLTVIRRAAEEARRNRESGRANRDIEFLTLRSLGGDRRWRKYLDTPDLDRRLEPRQRGSPRSTGHVVVRAGKFKQQKREEL
ncbi:MAG TPA: helix-turn-helix transcriptional regulator [Myxococcota bacterium]|nr:helix-turn-helix transcriptional regulator [Myxococcota bacterium]